MTDEQFLETISSAFVEYRGGADELESAIGALALGRRLGWKPLFLIHQRITIKNYERILKINFRDVLDDVGPDANRSLSWRLAQKVSNFWKAVRGEIANIRTPMLAGVSDDPLMVVD